MLRSLKAATDDSGHRFLTMTNAAAIDAGMVETYLRKLGQIGDKDDAELIAKKVSTWTRDFSDRLGMFYQDLADQSTVSAGVREQALMRGKTQPGDILGEMGQLLLMFKSWPLAAMHQMVMRDIYQSLDSRDMAGAIFGVIAASMVGGYMRMAIRAYSDGKPIPVVTDPATIMAAVAQGGGLGMSGDVVFGETNRSGADSFAAFVGGPIAGDLSALMNAISVPDLMKLFSHYKDQMDKGKIEDVWPNLATWSKNHIPGNNFLFLKGAIDYMMWYHIMDVMKPGWWERANAKSIKDHGEPMAGYRPGSPAPYGTVPWFGLKTYQPPHPQ